MTRFLRTAALLSVAAALAVGAACGTDDGGDDSAQDQVSAAAGGSTGEDGASGDDAGDAAEPATEPDGGGDQGAGEAEAGLEMTDVATGASTTLEAALAPEAGEPVLAWFWAPFCPTCRGEAPELDAFMAENADRVKMVGIGTRDDLGEAEQFLEDTGVEHFPLLWEPTGQSWVDNAVAAQPYMLLLADGEEFERWPGGASVRQIEDALAELGA